MNGHGVCLNNSDMLKDLLNKNNINSSIIVNLYQDDIKRDYTPDINIDKEKNKLLTKIIMKLSSSSIKKVGDHACVLINDNNSLYVYDPTNLLYLKVKDKNTAEVIAGTGKLILNPYFSKILVHNDIENQVIEKLLASDNYNAPYTKEEYINYWKNCMNNFENNKNLIEDYYTDAITNIEGIVDNIKEVKTKKKELRK